MLQYIYTHIKYIKNEKAFLISSVKCLYFFSLLEFYSTFKAARQ